MSEYDLGNQDGLNSNNDEEIAEILLNKTKEKANLLKEAGNAALASYKYHIAVEKYTEAISIYPCAIFYANRAQALIKLESFAFAIEDSNDAIRLDSKYVKSYYRRGSANYALGKFKEAKNDFKIVQKLVPNDVDSLKKIKACDKQIRERAFQEALDYAPEPELTEADINTIVVEDSYIGPRLDDNIEITMDFVKELIEHFRSQKLLHRKYLLQLLSAAKKYFKTIPSLIRLPLPVITESGVDKLGQIIVCGDTHGQFYDLLNIFELGGFPSNTNPYLFNGDFVDRGSFSFETVTTLLAIKLATPDGLFMLRGNHESKNLNQIYGFKGEIMHKYDDQVMRVFTDIFNWLPLAAVIQNGVFVVHGGISTSNEGEIALSTIESIIRGREPPEDGLMSDLLWSDPHPAFGKIPSKRGIGFNFGPDYTDRFLKLNNLKLVVRSHEVKDDGYEVDHNGKCITVFSAPNYCDQMGNKGAFIRFGEDLVPKFTQFTAVSHPNIPAMRYAANLFGL